MPAISIVIPTLNEAKELPETLRRAKSLDGLKEIIVVDAGSTDSTQDIAREAGCMTLECEPSRGRQLRLGAPDDGAVYMPTLGCQKTLHPSSQKPWPNQASSQAPFTNAFATTVHYLVLAFAAGSYGNSPTSSSETKPSS